ncbi:hypothetical protein ACXZ1M_04475 [Duganella sp. PWIR1]
MLVKKISVVAFCVAGGLSFENAVADEQRNDISMLIPDASEVASTTIVITPPGLMTRAPLTENKLLEFGCNYTENEKRISAVISIVKNNIKYDEKKVGKFYLRNIIYFNLKSGFKIRYVFSDVVNKNEEIYGVANDGSRGSNMPFLAQGGLLVGLREWILDDSVEKKSAKWCVEHK